MHCIGGHAEGTLSIHDSWCEHNASPHKHICPYASYMWIPRRCTLSGLAQRVLKYIVCTLCKIQASTGRSTDQRHSEMWHVVQYIPDSQWTEQKGVAILPGSTTQTDFLLVMNESRICSCTEPDLEKKEKKKKQILFSLHK